jgi:DNA-directed RNA polymerase
MHDLLKQQEQSEALSLGQGREQFDRRLEAAQSSKAGAAFGAARRLLSDGTDATLVAVTEWIAARKAGRGRPHAALAWIEKAGPDVAAYLTMLSVLNHIYGRERASVVAREISDRIALEFRARALKEQAPGLFKYKMPKLERSTSLRHTKFSLGQTIDYAEVKVEEMTEHQRLQVGTMLLHLAQEATQLFHLETQPVRKGKRVHQETYIWPTEDTQEWLVRRNEILAAASVRHRPMVVPPLDWDLGERGGYLFGLKGTIPLVNTWDDTHTEDIENAPMDLVYRALNGMQRTPWSINRQVLAVVAGVMEQGGGRYDTSDRVLVDRASVPMMQPVEMPARPHDMDTNDEANRKWRREASYRKEVENTQRQGKVRSFWRTFSIAREYAQRTPFFFPWNLDFRGRMYPVTDGGLSPQGDDLSRGLLQFAYGMPIDTAEQANALALHGASCLDEWAGAKVGTMTKAERLDLIDTLTPRIKAWAADPIGDDGWMEADKPLMFLARHPAYGGDDGRRGHRKGGQRHPERTTARPLRNDGRLRSRGVERAGCDTRR